MGILNVTPDSFSDGGCWLDPAAAIAHGLRLVAEGADMVDVGGESTRPGAVPVAEAEELRRVLPVVEALAPHVRVSIDTMKPAVARAAVAAGATLVNDVTASLHEVAAETGAGWVAMHMRGTPATMQDEPRYDDVVAEVCAFLAERVAVAEAAGVTEIWVDPGIGFGKTGAHNLSLLRHLDRVVALGRPVVVGTSRKGFLGALTGRSDAQAMRRDGRCNQPVADVKVIAGAGAVACSPSPASTPVDDRLEASLATATWALHTGARMVRVHDVLAHVQAAKVVGPGNRTLATDPVEG